MQKESKNNDYSLTPKIPKFIFLCSSSKFAGLADSSKGASEISIKLDAFGHTLPLDVKMYLIFLSLLFLFRRRDSLFWKLFFKNL